MKKKRPILEITERNSSCRKNYFKVLRITAKIYEKEIDNNVSKDKIISNDPRSFVSNKSMRLAK